MNPELTNALCALGWSVVIFAAGMYLLARRKTRWPRGHGESYFNQARTINHERETG